MSSAGTTGKSNFYPRSPCGERRNIVSGVGDALHFYPRSPCGERLGGKSGRTTIKHFYPRSPCGERLTQFWRLRPKYPISIHALLAESDMLAARWVLLTLIFLSTLSLRRATLGAGKSCNVCGISIHALLAESDIPPKL